MTENKVDVIIVGGGLAGLAAAGRLLENDLKVLVLEAESRVGGRVHTVEFGGSKIDLGAHWVGGEPVYSLASALDLLEPSDDFTDLSLFLDDGSQVNSSDARALLDALNRFADDKTAMRLFEGNLGQYYASRFEEKLKEVKSIKGVYVYSFIDWIQKFKCIQNGCDSLFDASPTTEILPVRDMCYRWKEGGYQTIIDLLTKDVEKSGRGFSNVVKLNQTVTKIDWRESQIVVTTANGGVFEAPRVIVTVSLGVLKDRYESLFVPCLPEPHINAIKHLGFGLVNKIFLKFKTRWWPEKTSGFGLLHSSPANSKISWEKHIIGFFTEEGHPLILTAWLVGDAAKEVELCSSKQVGDVCVKVLRQFVSSVYPVEEPECVTRTTWSSNPNFKGGYSFRSMASDAYNASSTELGTPIRNASGDLAILFAGEATSEKNFSTAHGALETGRRSANLLIGSE